MTAKNIPAIGDRVAGVFPGVMEVMKVTVGSDSSNDVQLAAVETKDLILVKAGTLIHEVLSQVKVAFLGGTATLTVGDSTSAAGFLASADIVPASSGAVFVKASGAGEAYALGKYYDADQAIQIVVGTAAITAGQLDLFFVYSIP